MRAVLLVLVAILAAACNEQLVPLADPSSTQTLVESPQPTPEPTPEPTPTPKPISVKVTKRTKSVAPSDTASVTVKTVKDADCTISVMYDSGQSEAKGLGKKNSGSDGTITWKWMVGSNAAAGEVPIEIHCSSSAGEGGVSTSFTVQ